MSATENFNYVALTHRKIQSELHALEKFEPTNEKPPELRAQLVTRLGVVSAQISRVCHVLKTTELTLQSSIDSGDRLENRVALEKYTARMEEMRRRLARVTIALDEVVEKYSASQRTALLRLLTSHHLVERDDKNTIIPLTTPQHDYELLSVGQKVLKTNQLITSTLQTTYQMMEANVLSSNLLIETFNESTNSLLRLSDKYDSISNTLLLSKRLVEELRKAEGADMVRMKWALRWVAGCSAWVIWRRLLRLPTKIVYWLFSKSFFGLWKVFVLVLYVFGVGNYSGSLVVDSTESVSVYFESTGTTEPIASVETAIETIEEVVIEMNKSSNHSHSIESASNDVSSEIETVKALRDEL